MTFNPSRAGRRARSFRVGLGLVVLFAACHPIRGCAESDFNVAERSRLPKWFTLPNWQNRSDVTVVMTYYTGPGGSTANFVLRDRNGRKLAEVEGPVRDSQPQTLTPASPTRLLPYPVYEVVTINGITEVIEHRQRTPIFDITDDPEVKRRIGVQN